MRFFLLLSVLLLSCLVRAQSLPSREVSLEWEEIRGATSYDVEVRQKGSSSKPVMGTSRTTIWNGKLVPGFYEMRVRAKDRRQVPGAWSEAIDLTVLLDPPTSDTLKKEMNLAAKDSDKTSYTFRWSPVAGAETYELKVTGADGKEIQKLNMAETSASVSLPVATQIKWSLMALRADGLASEAPLTGDMNIWGPALPASEPQKPANNYVREVSWEPVPLASSYAYSLQRFDNKTKKWTGVHSEKAYEGTSLKFSSSWPGGKYRLNLRAQAGLRKSSEVSSLNFDVVEGDRSAAAEYNAMLRQSIVRTTGWFVIASYLMTAMQYEGVNADNGGSVPLRVSLPNNIGGTGRLGLGYLSDRSPWGFLGVIDMSGFIVDGQTPNFMSFETNAIRRTVVGKTAEFRQQMGVFYKEIPEIIARDLSGIDRIDKIVAAGPHYGVEYWWAMSPKLGLQVNAHAYLSALSIKTPTGNDVTPSLTYQLGLLGSYRLTNRASGLIGYAYREDSQSYKSSNDRDNTVKITGHYLNLFLEWAL